MGNRLENRQQSSGHRVGCAHHGYIRMIFTMSSAFWLLSSVFRLMSPCLSSVIVHLSPFWCGTVLSSVVIWHQFFSTFISLTKVFSYSQQENIINRLIMAPLRDIIQLCSYSSMCLSQNVRAMVLLSTQHSGQICKQHHFRTHIQYNMDIRSVSGNERKE